MYKCTDEYFNEILQKYQLKDIEEKNDNYSAAALFLINETGQRIVPISAVVLNLLNKNLDLIKENEDLKKNIDKLEERINQTWDVLSDRIFKMETKNG